MGSTNSGEADGLSMFQLNAGKRKLATEEIEKLFIRNDNAILLLQEPGVLIYKNSNFTTYMANKNSRACIITSKGKAKFNHVMMSQFSDKDMAVIYIEHSAGGIKEKIILCSIYCPQMDENKKEIHDPDTSKLEKLISYCDLNAYALIIGGDFNAKSPLWCCQHQNKRGEIYANFFTSRNMNCMNSGDVPTWENKISESIIDVTWCNDHVFEKFNSWKVDKRLLRVSDHNWISWNIAGIKLERQTWDTKKFKANKFKKLLKLKLKDLHNEEPKTLEAIDVLSETLNNALISSYKEAEIKALTHCKNKWFNKELMKDRKALRKQWDIYKASKTEENLKKFREMRQNYTEKCIKTKTKERYRLMEKTDSIKDYSRKIKNIQDDDIKCSSTVRKEDGSYTADAIETQHVMIRRHCEGEFMTIERALDNKIFTKCSPEEEETINKIINRDNVYWAIHSLPPRKAPGHDGIFAELLQKGFDTIGSHLINLYRSSAKWGYIPTCWRSSKIIFIPKPGKNDYTNPDNQRPINLMSVTHKALEKVMENTISNDLGPRKYCDEQHAYRTGRSTETAIHSVLNYVEEESLKNGMSTAAIFVDLQKAFDKTKWPHIEKAFEERDVSKWKIRWVINALKSRVITSCVPGDTLGMVPTCGTAQGSNLSPLCFNLTADSLIKTLKTGPLGLLSVKVVSYADDTVIMTSNKFKQTTEQKLKAALSRLEDWEKKTGINVNAEKTKVMYFKNKKLAESLKLKYKGKELEVVSHFKYLGLMLDENLDFKKHIASAANKGMQSWHAVRRTLTRKYGASPKMSLWAYKAIAIPRMTYGSLFFWDKVQNKGVINKCSATGKCLNDVQRMACLGITGVMRSTPQNILNGILGLNDMADTCKFLAIKTCLRLQKLNLWGEVEREKGYTSIAKKLKSAIKSNGKTDEIPTVTMPEKKFFTHIGEREKFDHHRKKLSRGNSQTIEFWSDGSKKDGKVGAGYLCEPLKIAGTSRLPDYSTVYQAELYGILCCANIAAVNEFQESKIIIYTDSQAAILALRNARINSDICNRTIAMLNKLATNNQVHISWCPGHSGHKYNEKADRLANEARSNVLIYSLGAPRSEQDYEINQLARNEIINDITKTSRWITEAAKTKDVHILNEWQHLINWNRRDLRIISGVISNHNNLNLKLYRINSDTSPHCRFCMSSDESMSHILFECHALTAVRQKHSIDFHDQTSIDWKHSRKIVNFLNETGISDTFFRENPITNN